MRSGDHVRAATCKPGRGASREAGPASTLTLNFPPQDCEKRNFCCFSLWSVLFCYCSPNRLCDLKR